MRTHRIKGHDGVGLHVAEAGAQDAPAILLIHGWSQCHLSWCKQFDGLSDRFRIVAPDLRGHGLSDKPDPSAYLDSAAWAGDIAAVISTLSLDRPVLVGWSMGGWIVGDYLQHGGHDAISGAVLVGSNLQTGQNTPPAVAAERGPDVQAPGMFAEDLGENLAATVAFVRACFWQEPDPDDLAQIVGFNMLVPPDIRKACRTRTTDHRADFAGFTGHKMIFHGQHERVCVPAAFDALTKAAPDAEVEIFAKSGHSPFWEEPEAFNDRLAEFANRRYGVAA